MKSLILQRRGVSGLDARLPGFVSVFAACAVLATVARAQMVSYDPILIRAATGISYSKTNEFLPSPAGKTNTLNLATVDINYGDKFRLRTVGTFALKVGQNPDDTPMFGPEEPRPFLGVFSSVFTAFGGKRQVADPRASGLPGYITPAKTGGTNPVPTDIPEDFLIPPEGVIVLCLPRFGNFLGMLNPDPNAGTQDSDGDFAVEILPLEKARLKLTHNWSPTNPVVGETVTLTLLVTNIGNVPVMGLSADRTPYPTTPGVTSLFYRTNLMDYLSGPTPVSYSSVPPGGSVVFQYTFRAKSPGTNTLARFDTDKVICDTVRLDAFHEWLADLIIRQPLDIFLTLVTNRVGIGEQFPITVEVRNNSTGPITNILIQPPLLDRIGSGQVGYVDGPLPSAITTLAAGASQSVTYRFQAAKPGRVTFQAFAQGRRPDGTQVATPSASSNPVLISPGDLLIKRGRDAVSLFAGGGIYQTVALNPQIKSNALPANKDSIFQIQIKNHDQEAQSFILLAVERGNPGWKRTYAISGTDVSTEIETPAGAQLPPIPAGAALVLEVTMQATNAPLTDVKRIEFTLKLASDPDTILDAVEAVTELANEIIVNSTGDEPDADPADDVPDVDLKEAGLQTTLRCAIDFANRKSGKDIIEFKIPVEDPKYNGGLPCIEPKTALPVLSDPVIIDGWSQNSASHLPVVHLKGHLLKRPSKERTFTWNDRFKLLDWPGADSGLVVEATACEIRGLVIIHFPLCGIRVRMGGAIIQGNHIGVTSGGVLPAANGWGGYFNDGPSGWGLSGAGIAIESDSTLIGGSEARQGNVISGFDGTFGDDYNFLSPPGILIIGPGAFNNRVEGNIIGLSADGLDNLQVGPIPHIDGGGIIREGAIAGILIFDGANFNVIGGDNPGSRNVIAHNRANIIVTESAHNQILGNLIGLDSSGRKAVKSLSSNLGDNGIMLFNAAQTVIGGNGSNLGNVMGGLVSGIVVGGAASAGTLIQNNFIGTTRQGDQVPNGLRGIQFDEAANLQVLDNTLANSVTGIFVAGVNQLTIRGNRIQHNEYDGITLEDPGNYPNRDVLIVENTISGNTLNGVSVHHGSRITISRNLLFNNGGRGISLGVSGRQPNDIDDQDEGPNHLQNNPNINLVTLLAPSGLTSAEAEINGRLITPAKSLTGDAPVYRIEFFVSEKASSTGYGEGQSFLTSVDAIGGFSGFAPFQFATPSPVHVGQWITATATDSEGNTSEFSKAVQVSTENDNDHDGICDELEAGVPNGGGASQGQGTGGGIHIASDGGDGNGDGLMDSEQANVSSFLGIAGKWLTLAGPNGVSLKDVVPGGPPEFTSVPSGYIFPVGCVSFSVTGLVPGGTVAVTNLFHHAFAYTTVFAYGPTPDNPQPHWYEFLFNGTTGGTLGTDQVVLTLRDGARGDHDLNTNGVITTVLAPAYLVPPGPLLQLLSTSVSLVEKLEVTQVSTNAPVLFTNHVSAVTSVLAWPASATNYFLEYTDALSPTNLWRPVFNPPALVGNQVVVTNTSVDLMRFYRLRQGFVPVAQVTAPTLNIQSASTNTFLLSWPALFTGFSLQATTNLTSPNWVTTTNAVSVSKSQNQVLVAPATGSRFFRLISQ